jgi:hypothetical protein
MRQENEMKAGLRIASFMMFALAATAVLAADGVAFIANIKGEVALDGAVRPPLMAELSRGQKLALGKDGMVAVMFVVSGKEYVLKGPGDFIVGESDVAASKGASATLRQTEWRANQQVLVQVAQASSASIRMRSAAPSLPKADETVPRLLYPVDTAVISLQPTLRWHPGPAGAPFELRLEEAYGKGQARLAKIAGPEYHVAARLAAGTEYKWSVTASGKEIGSGTFRTLSTEAQAKVDARKPRPKWEFSDWLLYAMLLKENGANQDAKEVWQKLARERADLPEMTALAR